MRYPKLRKEESRQKIVTAASRAFRSRGIAATGIDEVMRGAGLTKGAFSAHFGSKDELVQAAVHESAEHSPIFTAAAETDSLEDLVSHYLGAAHRDHPECGCPVAALGPEIARLPKGARGEFVDDFEKMISFVESRLKGKSPAVRRETALSALATMIGTLQLARLATSKDASERILETGKKAVVKLAS